MIFHSFHSNLLILNQSRSSCHDTSNPSYSQVKFDFGVGMYIFKSIFFCCICSQSKGKNYSPLFKMSKYNHKKSDNFLPEKVSH